MGGRLELRLLVWLKDLVEKLSVFVLEEERLLPLGLVISSLLTAEIFDWLLALAGDWGALLDPGIGLKFGLVVAVLEDSDPPRVRLRPVLGIVLSPLAAVLRLSPLSRDKQS